MSTKDQPLNLRDSVLTLLCDHTKQGNFTLASGGTSDTYIDCRAAIMTGNGQRMIGQLLTKEVVKLIPEGEIYDKVLVIGGMATGAIPLVCATLHYLWMSSFLHGDIYAVYVREEVKAHGTQSLVEGNYPIAKTECVLLEDVSTTGNSICKAATAIRKVGLYINHAVSLVDRASGATELLHQHGIDLHPTFTISEVQEWMTDQH